MHGFSITGLVFIIGTIRTLDIDEVVIHTRWWWWCESAWWRVFLRT